MSGIMLRGFGNHGFEGRSRSKIWTHHLFLMEFGQRKEIRSSGIPDAHDVWLKYKDLLSRLVVVAEGVLERDDPKLKAEWEVIKAADKERFVKTKSTRDVTEESEHKDAGTSTVGFHYVQASDYNTADPEGDEVAAELERNQSAVLTGISDLLTVELSFRILPVLVRLVDIVNRTSELIRNTKSYFSWQMNFYLNKIMSEMNEAKDTLLKEPGDFIILPMLMPQAPDIMGSAPTCDFGIIVVEYETEAEQQVWKEKRTKMKADQREEAAAAKREAWTFGGNSLDLVNTTEQTFRVTIVNPNPMTKYHPKVVNPEQPEKIRQQVTISIPGVPRSRVFSEAWWACRLLDLNGGEKLFYTHFLPWLTMETFVDQMSLTVDSPAEISIVGSPIKNNFSFLWKSLIASFKYILTRHAKATVGETKLCRFLLRVGLMSEAAFDITLMQRMKHLSKVTLQTSLQEMATTLSRNAKFLPPSAVQALKESIDALDNKNEGMPTDEDHTTEMPPELNITNGWDTLQQADHYPLMECFRRIDSTEPFAGSKVEQPKSTPINAARIRPRATTLRQTIEVIDEVVLLLTRITTQHQTVRNTTQLATALITQTVIEVLPTPLGSATKKRTGEKCIWTDTDDLENLDGTKGLHFGQQLHLIKRLCELMQYHFSAQVTEQHQPQTGSYLAANRAVVTAQLLAIADAVMKVHTVDVVSLFCQHYNGYRRGLGRQCGELPAFSINGGIFKSITNHMIFNYPESLLVRQKVIDYFDETSAAVPPQNVIWNFRNGLNVEERSNARFLKQICRTSGSLYSRETFGTAHQGPYSILSRTSADYVYFRDLVVIARSMFVAPRYSNNGSAWNWSERVHYALDGTFVSATFNGQRLELRTGTVENVISRCNPRHYVGIEQIGTKIRVGVSEEDLLHVVAFGEIGTIMGQRDAELLLSYLTTPYLRIPLVLQFLATEDRASVLRHNKIRELVLSCLFEPGEFLTQVYSNRCPKMVPSENKSLLSCPYGLLINECCFNPDGVVRPLCRLVRLILDMDAGNISNSLTVTTIMFLSKLVAQVLDYLRMAKRMADGKDATEDSVCKFSLLRDVDLTNESLVADIKNAYKSLSNLVISELFPVFNSWVAQLEGQRDRNIDVVAMQLCKVREHMLLLINGMEVETVSASPSLITAFLSSILFLTNRYSWRTDGIEEVPIYNVIHRHRWAISKTLSSSTPAELGAILNEVVDSITRVGNKGRANQADVNGVWGLVAGHDSIARYCRLSDETSANVVRETDKAVVRHKARFPEEPIKCESTFLVDQAIAEMEPALKFAYGDNYAVGKDLTIVPNGLQDVELNLNTFSITFKNARLQQVPDDVARFLANVNDLFTNTDEYLDAKKIHSSVQCAMVDVTTNRKWMRLVGQDADVIQWKNRDHRIPLPASSALRFYPEELSEGEQWIYELFEPIRERYLVRSFFEPPIFILLSERRMSADNSVAVLSAVDSATGRKLRECYVYRDFKVVHMYESFSYARRFYRAQRYTSDERYTLYHQDPAHRTLAKMPPDAIKFEAGDGNPDASAAPGESILIVRHPHHPLNRSGSRETFMYSALMLGLLPDSVMGGHTFWQDDDDNIRGYPILREKPKATLKSRSHYEPPALLREADATDSNKSKETTNKDMGAFEAVSKKLASQGAAEEDSDEDEDEELLDQEKLSNQKQSHIIWIHWRELAFDPLGEKNTCTKIVRYADAAMCPRSSEDAIRRANKSIHTEFETEEDLELMAEDAKNAADNIDNPLAPQDLEAGAFQQSPASIDRAKKALKEKQGATASVQEDDLLLVNLMFARKGTPLHSLAMSLARLESLAHILAWTKDIDYDPNSGSPFSLDYIHIPTLKLSFNAKLSVDKSEYLLYSMDHAHLFVSNLRPSALHSMVQGIPYSLILSDVNGNLSFLVPALNLIRVNIQSNPYSVFILPQRSQAVDWYQSMDTRYYLYPVHVSLSFLFTPTLASSMYLLLLRYFARQHREAFNLAGTVGTDVQLTSEERVIFNLLLGSARHTSNELAVMARVYLYMSDSPVTIMWNPITAVSKLIRILPLVDVDCRLTASEERRLLHNTLSLKRKFDIIRLCAAHKIHNLESEQEVRIELLPAATSTIQYVNSSLTATKANIIKVRTHLRDVANRLREELDVRVPVDDLLRLYRVFSNFGQRPVKPIVACWLENRFRFLDGEHLLRDALSDDPINVEAMKRLPKTIELSKFSRAAIKDPSTCVSVDGTTLSVEQRLRLYNLTIDVSVPSMGGELNFYHNDIRDGCDVLSVKTMASDPTLEHLRNSENRKPILSKENGAYYCNMRNCRQGKCECGNCDKNCGPTSGCPCVPCRNFNIKMGKTLHELPTTLVFSKSQPTYMFFEVFGWIGDVIRCHVGSREVDQVRVYRNRPPHKFSCKTGSDFDMMYELATGTSKVKIGEKNSARDLFTILWPLTYDSRCRAVGIGHLLNFVLAHPKDNHRFHAITTGEARKDPADKILNKILDTLRDVATEKSLSEGESQNIDEDERLVLEYQRKQEEEAALKDKPVEEAAPFPPPAPTTELPDFQNLFGDDEPVIEDEDDWKNDNIEPENDEMAEEEEAEEAEGETSSKKASKDSKEKMAARAEQLRKALEKRQRQLQVLLQKSLTKRIPNQGEFRIDVLPRLPNREDLSTPLDRTSVMPVPSNSDCSKRLLEAPILENLSILSDAERTKLSLGVEEEELSIKHLCTCPLQQVLVALEDAEKAPAVLHLIRADQGQDPVNETLPFDLSGHEAARKLVAREMLSRIQEDVRDFASGANTSKSPMMRGLTNETEIRSLVTGSMSPASATIKARIELIFAELLKVREGDQTYMQYAIPVLIRTANHVGSSDGATLSRDAVMATLLKYAKREATLSFEYLAASLATEGAENDWRQLNPFLTPEQCSAMSNLAVLVVLRANRVAQISRACDAAQELLSWLGKASEYPRRFRDSVAVQADATLLQEFNSYQDAIVASVILKANALAEQLCTKRCYFSEPVVNKGGKSQRFFDPRFLLFEFTWSLVVRDRQREIITEMRDSIVGDNASIVKQMIMGAGKTTVVGPLLGVMLADGSNLVIQVVPPALLDFTRAVLRTTFSTVMRKQIFSFTCDRAGEVDSEILFKFAHARATRGIVVTTPNSIKSVFLKYVEALDRISDVKRPGRCIDDEKEAADIHQVMRLWKKAVLVMDEVDMILHPLKSELNFPVGPKEEIDFAPIRWALPIHLLDALFYCKSGRLSTSLKDSAEAQDLLAEFQRVVRDGITKNALQAMPHLTLLNVEFYDECLKPMLAKWLLLFIKSQLFSGLSDEDTLRYITKRPGLFSDNTKSISAAASKRTVAEEDEIRQFVAKVATLEESHIKVLNLSFEWLNCYIPHIWQKIDRVSYGIMNERDKEHARKENPNMPHSRFVTAIPFVGKDLPSQSSEFAHPDIVIGLTILAYRYEGLRAEDFRQIMTDVYAQVEAEVGKYSQRRTNLMFNRWVKASGGVVVASYNYKKIVGAPETAIEILPLKLLKQANEDEIRKVFKVLRQTPEVIHFYLSESVFPAHMRHQNVKLSASGQELGGNIIFDRRVGFSGTPSDLLPIELGRCEYERGTDGQLIYTLTNPDVISIRHVRSGWTVQALLNFIASQEKPYRYNALIDTGALITGMSNLQVATYLLRKGLKEMDGVVFLDELDRKMILVRATGRVLKLAECGIPKSRRFAFYDQVHTTGMDIEHIPNAVAIQTLGKDMTFRDFSQGAYRMRGIGVGQKVDLLLIPEVQDLIHRTLRAVKGGHRTELGNPSGSGGLVRAHSSELMGERQTSTLSYDGAVVLVNKSEVRENLQDVTAWLFINSIKSEQMQHDQLCLQCCSNVWRKEAFSKLIENMEEFNIKTINDEDRAAQRLLIAENNIGPNIEGDKSAKKKPVNSIPSGVRQAQRTDTVTPGLSDVSNKSINVFREPVAFEVNNAVPELVLFSDIVSGLIEASRDLITTEVGRNVCQQLLDRARQEDEVANPAVDVQVVQEQEEERDKEVEEERERQVEVEKFVELAYSRDSEEPTSWPLENLSSIEDATMFFPLSTFHLYKRQPLAFPSSIFLSKNFYSPQWSGHRRIKNVIVVLEWLPDTRSLSIADLTDADYGTIDSNESLPHIRRLIALLLGHNEDLQKMFANAASAGESEALLKDILVMALQKPTGAHQQRALLKQAGCEVSTADTEEEWETVLSKLTPFKDSPEKLATALLEVLAGSGLRHEETGRFFVAVSLAEAETLRRIAHLRLSSNAVLPSQRNTSEDPARSLTSFSLRASSCGFSTLDSASKFVKPKAAFSPARAYQCLRFFDCDLHYHDRELGMLLRSVHQNPTKLRQMFFQQVTGCRRRSRQRWERTPIAPLFLLENAFSLLHQRSIGLCTRRFVEKFGLSFGDAYMAFNNSHTGLLSPAEVWGGLRFCKLGDDRVSMQEVIDFIELVDSTHEGKIQYGDFLVALTGSKEEEEEDDDNAVSEEDEATNVNKRLPDVEPYGGDDLQAAMVKRARERREAESEASKEVENENKKVMDLIEEEELVAELERMQEAMNPVHVNGSLKFSFLNRQVTDEEAYGDKLNEDGTIRTKKKANADDDDDDVFIFDPTQNNEEDDDEAQELDEEEQASRKLLSIDQKEQQKIARLSTCQMPAVIAPKGRYMRSSLDLDGRSCVTLCTNTQLNFSLRLLKKLARAAIGKKPGDIVTATDLEFKSFALSAELRLPPDGSVLATNMVMSAAEEAMLSKKAPQKKKAARAQAGSTRYLASLEGNGSFIFATWLSPTMRRRAIPDHLFKGSMVLDPTKPQQTNTFDLKKSEQSKDLNTHMMDWVNKTYFFMEEGESEKDPTQRSSLGDGAAIRDVLRSTNPAKLAKKNLQMRLFANPRPPSIDSDIIGFIRDTDTVIAYTNERVVNEINEVAVDWMHVRHINVDKVAIDGWIVVRRQKKNFTYVAPEEGSATSTALPILPDGATFISKTEADTRQFDTLFDFLSTTLSIDKTGERVLLEHKRIEASPKIARILLDPLVGANINPTIPKADDLIEDREVEQGTALAGKGEEGAVELSADVKELMNMVWKAKRLANGDQVMRNPENFEEGTRSGNLSEVGVVVMVNERQVKVRWPGGRSEDCKWGQDGVFSLIKVAEAEESDEEEVIGFGGKLFKIKRGGLNGREVNNDDRLVDRLKSFHESNVKFSCNNCSKQVVPGDWFRCNHCDDFDCCRVCFKAGADPQHDFTDMGALEVQEVEKANKVDGDDGGDNTGFYEGSLVMIKHDVVAPRHGWGRELAATLDIQGEQDDEAIAARAHEREPSNSDPAHFYRPFNWPPLLSGFGGKIVKIDAGEKTATISIEAASNKKLLRDRTSFVLDSERNEDSYKDNYVEVVADFSEIEILREEDDGREEREVLETPMGFTNLYRTIPYVYYLSSMFEDKLAPPAGVVRLEGEDAEEKVTSGLEPLGKGVSGPRKELIKNKCPYLASMCASAYENIIPIPPNVITVDNCVISSSAANFKHDMMKKVLKNYTTALQQASLATQIAAANMQSVVDEAEKDAAEAPVLSPMDIAASKIDTSTLFNWRGFDRLSLWKSGYHDIMWTYTVRSGSSTRTVVDAKKRPTPPKVTWYFRRPSEEEKLAAMTPKERRRYEAEKMREAEEAAADGAATATSSTASVSGRKASDLFQDEFNDGGYVTLSTSGNVTLEGGFTTGTRTQRIFIEDDDYEVDLQTAEVRRLKRLAERDLSVVGTEMDDDIDLSILTEEQRNAISHLCGSVTRLPVAVFEAKEKPGTLDDGLVHLMSVVWQKNGEGGRPVLKVLLDGRELPIDMRGIFDSSNPKKAEEALRGASAASVLSADAGISMLCTQRGSFMNRAASAYHVQFDYVLEKDAENSTFGSLDNPDLGEEMRLWHESVLQATSWICPGCSLENKRTVEKCIKCKQLRRVKKSAQADNTSKFRAGTARSREAATVRSRLQGKLKAQYQRELDMIDRAMEEMRKTKDAEKKKAKDAKK